MDLHDNCSIWLLTGWNPWHSWSCRCQGRTPEWMWEYLEANRRGMQIWVIDYVYYKAFSELFYSPHPCLFREAASIKPNHPTNPKQISKKCKQTKKRKILRKIKCRSSGRGEECLVVSMCWCYDLVSVGVYVKIMEN